MINHLVHLEDEPHLLTILKVALKSVQPDLTVAQFSTGTEVLDYMRQVTVPVDVVILDIRIIGEITGLDVARTLRETGYTGRMIISSAYEKPDRKFLRSLDAEYISKPWRIEALLQHLLNQDQAAAASLLPPEVTPVPAQPGISREPAAITAELDRQIENIARLLLQSLSIQGVIMLVADAKTASLRHLRLYPPEQPDSALREPLIALASRIMQESGTLLLEDASDYLNAAATTPVSFAGLPFMIKSAGVIGSLSVFETTRHTWNKTDLDLLYSALELFIYLFRLNATTDELVEHNHELNAYTGTVAHDLKTPLAAVINYVDMIKMLFPETLHPEVNNYLSHIGHSANVMTDMITHLLWIARLEKPMESVSPVSMAPVIQAALYRLDYAITSRNVRVEVASNLPPVLGHEVWIEEVMANLVSNAVKYMGDANTAPCIQIRGYRIGTRVRYEVEDNGIGISLEDQAKLFQNFARLHRVKVEGLGLGLSIVHRMITRLAGEVGVDSEPGRGSIFWFTLPSPLSAGLP